MIGVPSPPYATGAVLAINDNPDACSGLKPRPMSSAAVTATGVPMSAWSGRGTSILLCYGLRISVSNRASKLPSYCSTAQMRCISLTRNIYSSGEGRERNCLVSGAKRKRHDSG